MTSSLQTRGIARITAIIIFAVLVVVAVALVGIYTWISTPSFCNACHIMSTRYVSWVRSLHWNKATCLQCHSEPGAIGELRAHLQGARYLYYVVTGTRSATALSARVSNASCERCHQPGKLGELIRGHDPNHLKHLELGMSCLTCHDSLVHGTLAGESVRPYMNTCSDCHTTHDPALASCTTCHPQAQLRILRQGF